MADDKISRRFQTAASANAALAGGGQVPGIAPPDADPVAAPLPLYRPSPDQLKDYVSHSYRSSNGPDPNPVYDLNTYLSLKAGSPVIADFSGLAKTSDVKDIFGGSQIQPQGPAASGLAGASFNGVTMDAYSPFSDYSGCSFVGSKFANGFVLNINARSSADGADFYKGHFDIGFPPFESAKKASLTGATGLENNFSRLVAANLENASLLGTDLTKDHLALLKQKYPSTVTTPNELAWRLYNAIGVDNYYNPNAIMTPSEAQSNFAYLRRDMDRVLNDSSLNLSAYPSVDKARFQAIASAFDTAYPGVAANLGIAPANAATASYRQAGSSPAP